jgi:peptide-methionine (S)-S-oxide reductase
VDAAHQRCSRRGDRIHHAPAEDSDIPGYYAFFVFDPDGLRIEVFAPGPGWSPRIHRPSGTGLRQGLEGRHNALNDGAETAILAGGCFWPAQELLRHREGVIATRVGYTGGAGENPVDDDHPGHAEAVEVVFDPERISYRQLLEFFFQIHRPDLGADLVGSGYRSEIFYLTDEQRQVAGSTIAELDAAGLFPGRVVTEISAAGRFWEAGAEDQDYLQRYPDGHTFFPRPAREAGRRETAGRLADRPRRGTEWNPSYRTWLLAAVALALMAIAALISILDP